MARHSASIFGTITSAENSLAARWRACRPKLRRLSSSVNKSTSAAASAATSCGSTRCPVRPSATASGTPPTRVATTGMPAAMLSRIDIGSASRYDGSANTQACFSNSVLASSSTQPAKRIDCSAPSERASSCQRGSSSPTPPSTNCAPGTAAVTAGHAQISSCTPLAGSNRPRNKTVGGVPVRLACQGGISIGLGTTTMRLPGAMLARERIHSSDKATTAWLRKKTQRMKRCPSSGLWRSKNSLNPPPCTCKTTGTLAARAGTTNSAFLQKLAPEAV